MRKPLVFGLCACVFAFPALGQNVTSKASSTIQCRPLNGSNAPIQADEKVIGDQICKAVAVPAVTPAASTETAATTASATVPKSEVASSAAAIPSSVSDQPQPQVQATIYFYRPRRFQGSALKPSVFVDDARVGQMHNGDSIKISLEPGSHRIYSTDKSTGMELNAKPGQTYYVRVDIQVGFWKGHGGVTLVDAQEGKYEAGQAAHQGGDGNQ